MATANFGEGAVFEISGDMITQMEKFDKHLQNIQAHSKGIQATGFQALVTALNGMKTDNVGALERFAKALQQISTASGSMGSGIQNVATGVNSVGTAAQTTTTKVEGMKTSISQTSQLLNQLNSAKNTPTNAMLGMQNLGPTQQSLTAYKKSIEDVRSAMASLLNTKLGGKVSAMDIQREGVAKYIAQLRQLKAEQDKLNPSLYPQAAKQSAEISNIIRLVTQLGSVYSQSAQGVQRFTQTLASQTASNQAIAQMVTHTTELKNKIKECEGEFERMKAAGTAYNTNGGLTAEAKAVAAKKKAYEEELRLINQTSAQALAAEQKKEAAAQRAAAAEEKAAQRAAAAQEKAKQREEAAAQKAAEKAEKEAQRKAAAEEKAAQQAAAAQRIQYLNNPDNALKYSKTTTTARQDIEAIQRLKQAKLDLDRTDKQYNANLQKLNAAIKQHEKNLQQAGIQSQRLQGHHRNLMDLSGQLQRQIALMFSVSSIEGFITKVAEIRGEFELQQRSLESLLQNKTEADQLFNKTVQLAVKSPFTIRQLVSYTKQLAAYRIESDELYDTTKRLADVSAGLGVDMQRLILAYGQVKAAAYLRGTEVRQFTEAGVNMYGELQSYFKEVKGEAYTTAQIVDMISKRKVTFEDVEQVFKRIAGEGGMFYNMQEVQSETLRGKIMNLKDSFDIMYNEIGKGNQGILNGVVDGVKALVDNWETVATVVKSFLLLISALTVRIVALKVATAVMNTQFVALIRMQYGLAMLQSGMTKFRASIIAVGTALKGISASSWIALAIGAVVSLIYWLSQIGAAAEKAREEFEKELNETNNKLTSIDAQFNSNKTKDGMTIFDQQKKALEDLQKVADEKHIEIGVDLASVTEENIQQVYNDARKKISEAQSGAYAGKVSYAGNEDEITEYNEKIRQLRNSVDILKASALSLSKAKVIGENTEENKKRAQIILTLLNQENVSVQDLVRAYRVYNDIRNDAFAYRQTFSKEEGTHYEKLEYYYTDEYGTLMRAKEMADDAVADVYKKTGEMKRTYAGVLNAIIAGQDKLREQLNSKNVEEAEAARTQFMNRVYALLTTDTDTWTEAAQAGLLAYIDEWARYNKLYGLTVKFDEEASKKEAEKTQQSIDKQLKEFFNSRTYTVKFTYEDLGNKDLGKTLTEEGKEAHEAAEAIRANIENIRRAKQLTFNMADLGLSEDQWRNNFGYARTSVTKDEAIKVLRGYAQMNDDKASDAGYRDPKQDKKDANRAAEEAKRREQALWDGRISVLKDMQSKYEELKDQFGEGEARLMTKNYFEESLKEVNMDAVLSTETLVPDKDGIIRALETVHAKLVTMGTDYKKKAIEVQKYIADLKVKLKTDEAEKKLDELKEQVDHLFDGLDLHDKLKDAGLSEKEVQALFPGLAKTLDEVEEGIRRKYSSYAYISNDYSYLDPQTKAGKQYKSEMDKVREQRIKEQEDLVSELAKNYKMQLSEQLQLDNWYYRERLKIAKAETDAIKRINADTSLSESERQTAIARAKEEIKLWKKNLRSQYDEKTDKNSWEVFKKSDIYLSMFEGDLENMPTQALERMKKRLDEMKESLKNLDPSQLKEIGELYQKIEEQVSLRSPLSALIDDFKKLRAVRAEIEAITGGKSSVNAITERMAANESSINKAESIARGLNRVIEMRENANVATSDVDILSSEQYESKTTDELKTQLSLTQALIDKKKKENDVLNKGLDITNQTSGDIERLKAAWGEVYQKAQQAWGSVKEMLQAMGEDSNETSSAILDICFTLADAVVQSLMLAAALKAVGKAANSAAGVIGYILMAIEAVVSIVTMFINQEDKKLQKQIKNLQQEVENLAYAFDNLKESMDNALSMASLKYYSEASIANLEAQAAKYEEMASAEGRRKSGDESTVNEYIQKAKELRDEAEDVKKELLADAGGFGTDENYKSAAQAFADAWVDAFNEGEDALEALNDKWDEYIQNLIKKQVMLRVVGKKLEPIFQKVDEYVSDKSEGGMNLTYDELADLQARFKEAGSQLNEELSSLMDSLGYSSGAETNISELQQGIQTVTESTAEVLEALLNSMRFYLATQQGDVAIIRSLLQAHFGTTTTSPTSDIIVNTSSQDTETSNPMLVELKSQTGYLRTLSENFASVLSYNGNSRGRGIRVYVQ